MHPRDALYLYADRKQHDARVVYCFVLNTAGGLTESHLSQLRSRLANAFAHEPSMHSRLLHTPLGLDYPVWAPVESPYNLNVHTCIHNAGMSSDQVRCATTELASQPLDVTRPPWHVDVFPDVTDIPEAPEATIVTFSYHHSAFNGALMSRLIGEYFSTELPDVWPESADDFAAVAHHGVVPSESAGWRAAGSALIRLPFKVIRLVTAAVTLFRHSSCNLTARLSARRHGGVTRFASGLSGVRHAWFTNFPLSDADRMRAKVPGATLVDMTLSVVGEALHQYAAAIGDERPSAVAASVPVLMPTDTSETVNKIRSMAVDLGGDLPARERLAAIVECTREKKEIVRSTDAGDSVDAKLIAAIPAPLMAMVGRLGDSDRRRAATRAPIDAVVSSARTPGERPDLFGMPILSRYIVQSLAAPTLAHSMTVVGDKLSIGVTADTATIVDIDAYIATLRDSFEHHRKALA